METILTKIQSKAPGMSRGQKSIANYILAAGKEAALLTAAKLGKTVGVSESTVVRFALELGYDGYPAMQRDLQACLLGDVPLPTGPDSPFGREIESQISLLRRMEARGTTAISGGRWNCCGAQAESSSGANPGRRWCAGIWRICPGRSARVLGLESLLEARAGDTALLLFLEREDGAIPVLPGSPGGRCGGFAAHSRAAAGGGRPADRSAGAKRLRPGERMATADAGAGGGGGRGSGNSEAA